MNSEILTPTYRTLRHEPALDGIRGIAVILVVVWHFPPEILNDHMTWFKSGHIGVDIFFVLSGFLITALMLNEHNLVGRISIRSFYRRRAFRLLPALIVFLVAHFIWAFFVDLPSGPLNPGTDLENEIASVLSALFFSINLLFLTGHTATAGIGHLWSLAVEEQFYIIWPFLTIALLSACNFRYQLLAAIAAALFAFVGHSHLWSGLPVGPAGLTSVIMALFTWAALLSLANQHYYTRALAVLLLLVITIIIFRAGSYDGSLRTSLILYASLVSRADSLIVGAVLAYLWVKGAIPCRCHSLVSAAGWIVLAWIISNFTLEDPFFYKWGWTLTAMCSALAIWGSLGSQGTIYGKLLTMKWLRSVGKVAYGLYLWHVFIFEAVGHWLDGCTAMAQLVVALGITALVTGASWQIVERPILARKR